MEKIPFNLSIDFEDLSYDICRSIGVAPKVSHEALELSYHVINNFSEKKLNGKKLTFFATGTVARTVPNLLKQMIIDGHEVGSHYNFHDLMFKQSNYEISKNLEIGKELIFKACGREPMGFRAPIFSINNKRLDIFNQINKFFKYDSSYILNLNIQNTATYKTLEPFKSIDLVEFPIVPKGYFMGKIQIKSGGTFLRLFPCKIIKEVMYFNHKNDFIPQVYMHPYDYLCNQEFWLPFNEFYKSKKISSFIKYFRQNQWSRMGNSTVFKKLNIILNHFYHTGPILENLKINKK